MTRIEIVLGSFLLFFSRVAFACDPCALYSAMNAGHHKEGAFTLSVFEQYTSFDKGDEDAYYSLRNGEVVEDFSTTQLNASYGVSEHIAFQVSVPFILRNYDEVSNFRRDSSSDGGLGDISILLQVTDTYKYQGISISPSLYAGLKLPTGDTGSIEDESQDLSKHHVITGAVGAGRILTFGSGSFDFPLGVSLSLVKDRLVIPSGFQYTIRTEGSYDYRFNNDLFWYANPGVIVLLHDDYSMSLNAFLSGENKEADKRDGERVSLSSFSNLFLGPSLSFTYGSNASLEFAYQRRITSEDNAIIVPEDRLRFAVSYRF